MSAVAHVDSLYHHHRFPPEIIGHAAWLYFRFSLTHRDVEELLAERGIRVSYEAIRLWCHKFGPAYAAQLRRRRARPGDKWRIDEVAFKINGRRHWLWRAVDSHGIVLDIWFTVVVTRRPLKHSCTEWLAQSERRPESLSLTS